MEELELQRKTFPEVLSLQTRRVGRVCHSSEDVIIKQAKEVFHQPPVPVSFQGMNAFMGLSLFFE